MKRLDSEWTSIGKTRVKIEDYQKSLLSRIEKMFHVGYPTLMLLVDFPQMRTTVRTSKNGARLLRGLPLKET
jgi:hypothetical protein